MKLASELATVLAERVAGTLGAPERATGAAVVWNAVASGDPSDAGMLAEVTGGSWRLHGHVGTVLWREGVGSLLVVSRSRPIGGRNRGLRVHHVALDAHGVSIEVRPLLDGDARAVRFDDVEVTDADAVGPSRDGGSALSVVFDHLCIAVVGEMLTAAERALDTAVSWVKEREQFGAPLAAKQAVQHRAADMATACAAVRGLLDDAHAAAGAGGDFAVEACVAKLVASARLQDVTASAHQLHGGEGYYADRGLHRDHKRVLTLAALFGNAPRQQSRLAELVNS